MSRLWHHVRRLLRKSPAVEPLKPGPRRNPLLFDTLEERSTPANLAVTSIGLVDGVGAALVSPQTGERVAVKVNWTTQGLTASDSYRVSATVAGVTLQSGPLTGGADGAYTTTLTGWYAVPGSTTYTAAVDSLDSIVETNEADNASGTQMYSAIAPTSLPTKFSFPVNVLTSTYADWALTSYVDVNPNGGVAGDYTGGGLARDGSTGVDITLPNFATQDLGRIRVLAAAPGAIEAVADSSFDRETAGSVNAPNYVRINHGNGWKTEYFNLAIHSTTLRVGDAVAGGQTIGLVGSSGDSRAPHLGFVVTHNGVPVETFLDSGNYWKAPLAYQGTAGRELLDQGITNTDPTNDLLEKPVGTSVFVTSTNWDVWYYARFGYLAANDVVQVDWIAPDFSTALSTTYTAASLEPTRAVSFQLPYQTWAAAPLGGWRVNVSVNGAAIGSTVQTFTTTSNTANGVPNFRVTAGGQFVQRGRESPVEFGTTTVGGNTRNQTFTINNNGAASLLVSNVVIPSGFAYVGAAPTNPTTLAPGQTLTFTLRLDVAAAGDRVGALLFDTNVNGTNAIYLRGTVSGSPPVGSPSLFFPGAAATTFQTTAPFVLEPAALFADTDSANFNTGRLVIDFLNTIRTENVLAVRNQGTAVGQIGVSGNNITYNPGAGVQTIGTQTLIAGTSLTVVFNNLATPAAIQALIRNITYADTLATPTPGLRHIRFRVTDETGKVSNNVVKSVYPAPSPVYSTFLTITETGTPAATAVVEGGASDSYNIVLTVQPIANVVVSVLPLSQVTTPVSVLTFTPSNWNVPQTVNVSAIDDSLAEGTHAGAITHSVVSNDSRFNGIIISNISPTITDNDAGVVVLPSGGSTNVSESGTTDSVTISLSSAPTANVTVTLTPNSQVTVSPTTLTFTPANFNIPQTVTIAAVNDGAIEGVHTGMVAVTSTSSDASYNGPGPTIVASIADNDVAGVLYTPTGGTLVTNEDGATASYSVVLTSQPSSPVTITIDPGLQVTTTPTGPLTFNAGNWNVPQLVTVAAVNDFVAEGNHTGTILHSLASSDPNYATFAGPSTSLTVTILDNDVASVVFTQSSGATDVVEGGATDTITVVLTSQPTDDVAINTYTFDGQTTLSPDTLVFTAFNWNVPQTITVTAFDDVADEGAHTGTIDFTIDTFDVTYAVLDAPTPIVANITDNDSASILLAHTGGSSAVSEAGGSDTYSVVLNRQPTADVTVVLTTPGSQLTTGVPNLVFTPLNWDTPQFVTIQAVDDDVAEGPHSGTVVHTGISADTRFNTATNSKLTSTLTASIADNDTAGVTVFESGGATVVTEGGNSDDLTIRLNTRPTADVTVFVNVDSQLFAGPGFLVFTASNFDQPQTVIIAALDDLLIEGNHNGVISFSVQSIDLFYNGLSIPSITAVIADNDALGVLINQSESSTIVTEGGAGDVYTIALTAQPFADVNVSLSASSQVTLSATTLTFTTTNWNLPQNVTVTAVDDPFAESAQVNVAQITHTASSADSRYNGIGIVPVVVQVLDNDFAGMTFVDTTSSALFSEGGAAHHMRVTLSSQPVGDVTIKLDPGDQISLSQTTFAFTSANWNVPQTLFVNAVDDSIAEPANHQGFVGITATSVDPTYAALNAQQAFGIIDNDNAGFVIDQSGGTTVVTEGVSSDTYTIALRTRPTGTVTITPVANPRLTYSPVSITFSEANWNVPQAIQVNSVNDNVASGNVVLALAHTIVSSDPTYAAFAVPVLNVTVNDDDFVGIVINPATGISLDENPSGSNTSPYSVSLSSQPTANVTVTLTGVQVSTDLATLVFTPSNWNQPRLVNVTAIDDAAPEGSHTGRVIHTATSGDPSYNGFTGPDLVIAVTDDDYGIVVTETNGGTTVTEGGGSDTISLRLSLSPTDTVTVSVTPSGLLTANPSTVTFTTSNWNVPQTVTLSATNDFISMGPQTYSVNLTTSSGDANYQGKSADVTVHVVESLPDIVGRDQNGVWTINRNTGSSFAQSQPFNWSAVANWTDTVVGDFNGDGRDDIASRYKDTGQWYVSYTVGANGYVTDLWETWSFGITWVDVMVGDFNNDGKFDILGRAKDYNQWWLARSTGTGFQSDLWGAWNPDITWVDSRVGDFDDDGKTDVISRALEHGDWWVGLSTGSGFNAVNFEHWNQTVTWVDVRVGDFNGDGKTDIFGRALEHDNWWVGLSNGSKFTTNEVARWNPGMVWNYISVGDFDKDGLADVIGRSGDDLWVGLSNGTTFNTTIWARSVISGLVDQFSFDFDGDGRADYAGRSAASGQWFVYLANSTGDAFSQQSLWTSWLSTSIYKDVRVAYTLP